MAVATREAVDCHVIYRIVQVHELPTVDLSNSVKSHYLSFRHLQKFNRLARVMAAPSAFGFMLSCVSGMPVPFVTPKLGGILALVTLCLQLPILCFAFSALRVGIARLLMGTYDYWFFTTVSVSTSIVFACHVADMRALLLLPIWIGQQLNALVDAHLRGLKTLTVASMAGFVSHVMVIVAVAFSLMPGASNFVLFRYQDRTLSSSDFIVNGFATMNFLLLRTVYRKRKLFHTGGTTAQVVRCLSLRCQVRLEAVTASSLSPLEGTSSGDASNQPSSRRSSQSMSAMQLVSSGVVFDSRRVVWPRICPQKPLGHRSLWLLYALGALGFSLTVVMALTCGQYDSNDDGPWSRMVQGICVVALTSTIAFTSVFAACYQSQLLRHLVLSFDFLFVSLQLTLAHLVVAVLVSWDARCFGAFASWIWMHWVLTLDALTPVMKSVLRFRMRYAAPVVTLFLVAQTVLSYQLVAGDRQQWQDHVLWAPRVWGHAAEFRAVPFFFSRVWTLMIWSCRILWRMVARGRNDLIIIQGAVEFDASSQNLGASRRSFIGWMARLPIESIARVPMLRRATRSLRLHRRTVRPVLFTPAPAPTPQMRRIRTAKL